MGEREVELTGGVAHAGAVVRVGGHVLRPANPNSGSIFRFLRALRTAGFEGVPEPVGIDADGRERLAFIEGDVPIPPYPAWARTERAVASIAVLMRRFHDAAAGFDPEGATWSDEMADPAGGPLVCHNDVCLENVVFRSGFAVGLLDFEFAAPGRPAHDVAAMARMCVPIDDDANAARLGWGPRELGRSPERLRLVCDSYGLDVGGRSEVIDGLTRTFEARGEFLRRRVAAGDANFTKMWDEIGGATRFEHRLRWWGANRARFASALA